MELDLSPIDVARSIFLELDEPVSQVTFSGEDSARVAWVEV